MKYLFTLIKPFSKQVIVMMFVIVVQSLCSLFMPYVMSDIVEIGIRNGNMNYILIQGAVMIALAAGALTCALINNAVSSGLSACLCADLRKKVFNKVNALSFEQFSELGTGSLITRTTDDVDWISDVVVSLPHIIVNAPTMFIGGVILSFRGDWLLPLIFLGISVAALVSATFITSRMDKYWQRGDEFTDVQNRVVRERLSGIRVVRAFNKEGYEHRRAVYATHQMNNSFVKANTISGLISPMVYLFLNLATVAIIYVGAIRLQTVETLKAGDILATIQYISFILNAILMMSWTISDIPRVKVCLKRIREVLSIENNREEPSSGERLGGNVTFEKLCFAYDGSADALSDVDFSADEGQIVGIIGGTGSGKTTMIKMLLDFYPQKSGSRFLGGRSYDELSPATVRDNVAVALQKSMIFEGTIAYNVKIGNQTASEEQVSEALRIAQMSDFLAEKAEGADYQLTQAGNNLSGGQKQRINIARTILKPASVYVFDDSFSALDYLTEANLRSALNAYLKGKTQIIVTQRAATAMHCDKVYVMDKGRVVGVGTHERLLETCDIYKEIYRSQMGGDGNV